MQERLQRTELTTKLNIVVENNYAKMKLNK